MFRKTCAQLGITEDNLYNDGDVDRDNFLDLEGLWQPSDSRLFYRTVMSLNRFKLLFWCLRLDKRHTVIIESW